MVNLTVTNSIDQLLYYTIVHIYFATVKQWIFEHSSYCPLSFTDNRWQNYTTMWIVLRENITQPVVSYITAIVQWSINGIYCHNDINICRVAVSSIEAYCYQRI